MKYAIVVCLFVTFIAHTAAQKSAPGQKQSSPPPSEAVLWPTVPVTEITFKTDESLPVIPNASGVMEYPIQCGIGDRYFISMGVPPKFTTNEVYAVSRSQGVIKYSLGAIGELHDVFEKGYSPTDSGVLFLVNATSGKEKQRVVGRGRDGGQIEGTVHAGEHVDYLLKFDALGAFRGKVEIDSGIRLSRVAMFSSGTYLGIGLKRSDSSLHLMLLDENGTLLRLLDPPKQLSEIAQELGTQFQSSQPIVPLAPWVQFVPVHDNMLVVPSGSREAVFEVRPGGEITVLSLKLPKGATIGAFVPSADHLYGLIVSPKDDGDLTKAHLYEFDRDGVIVRELKSVGARVDEIACEQGGAFVAFRTEEDGRFVALKGRE